MNKADRILVVNALFFAAAWLWTMPLPLVNISRGGLDPSWVIATLRAYEGASLVFSNSAVGANALNVTKTNIRAGYGLSTTLQQKIG